jgi:hypothetical protein
MSAFEQGKFIWLDHVYGWQDILVKYIPVLSYTTGKYGAKITFIQNCSIKVKTPCLINNSSLIEQCHFIIGIYYYWGTQANSPILVNN